ncbi:XRE family transcriptional regulator [Anaerococcus sp.]|uniref:LexA family protein n=1 Tax=Anaerococcus sp. TaxID=1872515 RepID=UPI0028FDFBAF|nr:XRE family transcriptional regulator [Anaerococcus sp.]MDU3212129.1 XRE family transcriptional regulator [Anaerococcus sp.]
MSIGKRLRMLREDLGLKQESLADLLNVNRASISLYESNKRKPSQKILMKYSEIFDVSTDYILGNSRNLKKGEDYATINVYGSIPAGIPIEAIEDISDTEDISFKDFDKNKTYIGLKVDGDSMYPKYLNGDTIIIELTKDCESGTDAAVYVNGYEATLKTVIKNDNGTITLKPINTSYSPKTYGKDDEPIKILGIVKEIRRKI